MKKSILLLLSLLTAITGCAPLFSDMQGARLVGKRQFELTPGYSSVAMVSQDYKGGVANFAGLQAAYGLSDQVDLRFRYEHAWLKESFQVDEIGDMPFNIYSIGPKINVVRDRVSLFLPMLLIAESLAQFQPTFLFTVPLAPRQVEFNPSVKYLFNLCSACSGNMVAFNFGMAFSNDTSKWAIRPEYGVLYSFADSGRFSNFSIGLSFKMSRDR